MKNKFFSYLWVSQTGLAIIILITSCISEAIFLKAFFVPGNRIYTFHQFILPLLPGTLLLVFMVIASFKHWRIAIFMNIISIYYTVNNILVKLRAPDNTNFSIKYIDTLSSITFLAWILLNIVGIIFFGYIIYRRFKRQY